MKSLCIASAKGGVGKTTVSLNLAFAMAKRGARVLLADLDPQGAVAHSLGRREVEPGLAGFLAQGLSLEGLLLKTRLEGFSLLPMGDLAVEDTPGLSAMLADGAPLGRLLREAKDDVDLLLLDTPCGFGGITRGALSVSDHVLLPVQAEPLSLRTLDQTLEAIAGLRGQGLSVELLGVVITMLQQRDPDSLAIAEELWSRMPPELVLDTTIPRDKAFLRASGAGVPLGLLGRRPPPVHVVFDRLAQELEERLGLDQKEEDDAPIPLLA